MIELYLAWKPKFVSWMSQSPTLEPIEGVYAWSTSKAKSSPNACLPSIRSSHFKQILKDYNQGWSLPSASPSHFIIIKIQAYQVSSIVNGPRRSKLPNFASLHIRFAISWLSLKFVCLFHVSMFLWIQKFHVASNVLCLCIYIKKKPKKKKKSRFPNLSQKRVKFSIEKSLWTRGIRPLSCFKKKKKSSN